MKLLARLFALFLIMPIVELALLVQVDRWIGFWPTIGIVVFTGLLGGFLARREGLSVWRRLNNRLAEGGLPGKELLDGVIILVAGALLITPGVLTDILGLLGLLPPTRAVLRKYLMKRIDRAMQRGTVSMAGFDGWGSHPFYERPQREAEETRWQGAPYDVPRHADAPRDPSSGDGLHEGDRTLSGG